MNVQVLLRQLSELHRGGHVTMTKKMMLKEKMLSEKNEDIEARDLISEMYFKRVLNENARDGVDRMAEQLQSYEVAPHCKVPLYKKKEVEKDLINSFHWLQLDKPPNPYIHGMHPICWQLVFQFLSLPNILGNIILTCKSFNDYCDQYLFKILVHRDFKAENTFIPTECPDWRLLLRDTLYKWSSKRCISGDGVFNIEVFARFRTGDTGYEARMSPKELEVLNKRAYNKEKKRRKIETRKVIEKKKEEERVQRFTAKAGETGRRKIRSPSWKSVPKGHPDYVAPEVELKYVPVKQNATILSVHPKLVRTWMPNLDTRTFAMNGCFDGRHKQSTLYNLVASRITTSFLFGFNGTLLVYGQTGSGKTYTMFGPGKWDAEIKNVKQMIKTRIECAPEYYGIIPRTCSHILNVLQLERGTSFSLIISYVEIYQDKTSQLAGPTNVRTMEEVIYLLIAGQRNKTVFATAMNDRSSRAHTVFTLSLTQTNSHAGKILESTYHMVDLAGSERIKKSKAVGQRVEEAKHINKSLSTLERCILRLSQESAKATLASKSDKKSKNNHKVHIPYRDSELTRLLEQSLTGNAQTTMIICAHGADSHTQETLSTLRFGERAGKIKNTVKQKDIIKDLEDQIHARERLAERYKKKFTLLQLQMLQHLVELDQEIIIEFELQRRDFNIRRIEFDRKRRERDIRRARGERFECERPLDVETVEAPLVVRLKAEKKLVESHSTPKELKLLWRYQEIKENIEELKHKLVKILHKL